jgi:hypothetical protein
LITTVLFGEIDGDWMKKKKKIEIICHHGGYVVTCFRFMFFLEFAQSPDYEFFNIFYDLFLCSFGILLPETKDVNGKSR